MKCAVIIFPGSNCDDDIVHVLQDVMGLEVNKVWHKETQLQDMDSQSDAVFLPGGFSYGDYLRCGALAGLSPIMKAIKAFANSGGKVIGICNGFQILCEAGLLPGVLLRNEQQKFICKNIYIKVETTNSEFTCAAELGQVLKIPIAHAEGRFHTSNEELDQMEANDQILLRYCDENGALTPESNINGSTRAIAGICNAGRNVFGMMPHPERASEEILGNTDGRILFQSLLKNTLTPD